MTRLWPALTALLAALLLAELALPLPGIAPQHLPSPTVNPNIPQTDAAVSQWSETALARPLFASSRRPADQGSSDDGLPRLSAIIVTNGTRSAIFSTDGQKPQILGEGGTVGGYRVRAILPDQVQLDGPSGPLTLRPQFITPPPAAPATDNNS
jgi:general secretion pathway protein N